MIGKCNPRRLASSSSQPVDPLLHPTAYPAVHYTAHSAVNPAVQSAARQLTASPLGHTQTAPYRSLLASPTKGCSSRMYRCKKNEQSTRNAANAVPILVFFSDLLGNTLSRSRIGQNHLKRLVEGNDCSGIPDLLDPTSVYDIAPYQAFDRWKFSSCEEFINVSFVL